MRVAALTTTSKFELTKTGPRRGDRLPTGGRFVGDAATRWVSYGDDADFRQMCADFDRIWGSAERLRRFAAVA